MAQTFFFYDLETSGLSARDDRIMQFAGQRTDMDLRPVGEPFNVLVKLNDDTHDVFVEGLEIAIVGSEWPLHSFSLRSPLHCGTLPRDSAGSTFL